MVYIDDANIPYGRMIMSHMKADTTQELLDMATAIGIDHKWIQDKGSYFEHFDVCLKMKKKALKLGAKNITRKELGELLLHRKPPAVMFH